LQDGFDPARKKGKAVFLVRFPKPVRRDLCEVLKAAWIGISAFIHTPTYAAKSKQ
jgi:hypothetical protein